jgi:phosphomannomutase
MSTFVKNKTKVTLIKSISGIRGTIGGKVDQGLTPVDAVKFAAAYGTWLINKGNAKKVIIGRDARISGPMIQSIVSATLTGLGIDVVDLGLATTPTVEMAVPAENAGGGIILTASHNPKQWNALKLLNEKGEFISGEDGNDILEIASKDDYVFAEVDKLGKITEQDYLDYHIDKILEIPFVDVEAIKARNFKLVIDCVNSVGGIAIPALLKRLGVEQVEEMYCEPTGLFPHNPEPLPEHLTEISSQITRTNADLGIVVDPDVDRLAMVCEDGSMFGEEYTLVAVADYILKHKKGNTVSNLSSTRALRDVTRNHGAEYNASAVGEVNVVTMMKETNAVIGGEGNGGIIYPELHYGRDALVGIALFLSHMAKENKVASSLRASYPSYFMYKGKIQLVDGIDVDQILAEIKEKYKNEEINTVDGVKIEFENEWVHLRKSNTEPIIRIYAEGQSETIAHNVGNKLTDDIKSLVKELV